MARKNQRKFRHGDGWVKEFYSKRDYNAYEENLFWQLGVYGDWTDIVDGRDRKGRPCEIRRVNLGYGGVLESVVFHHDGAWNVLYRIVK